MSIDYTKYDSGRYVYLPKIGEKAEYSIKEIRVVKDGNPKFHFKQREKRDLEDGTSETVEKNLGWHIEAELTDGKILSVSSFSAFFQVFKKHDIQDNQKIKVEHQDKGVWLVEKM